MTGAFADESIFIAKELTPLRRRGWKPEGAKAVAEATKAAISATFEELAMVCGVLL